MRSAEILHKILQELHSLSQEKPKDFYYIIDGYADDYDKNSLRNLIIDWELLENKKFKDCFPKTANLVEQLTKINDGIERDEEIHKEIITRAAESASEIIKFLSNTTLV